MCRVLITEIDVVKAHDIYLSDIFYDVVDDAGFSIVFNVGGDYAKVVPATGDFRGSFESYEEPQEGESTPPIYESITEALDSRTVGRFDNVYFHEVLYLLVDEPVNFCRAFGGPCEIFSDCAEEPHEGSAGCAYNRGVTITPREYLNGIAVKCGQCSCRMSAEFYARWNGKCAYQ